MCTGQGVKQGARQVLRAMPVLKAAAAPTKAPAKAKRATVIAAGAMNFEAMAPRLNDPATSAEKHSIARCPRWAGVSCRNHIIYQSNLLPRFSDG